MWLVNLVTGSCFITLASAKCYPGLQFNSFKQVNAYTITNTFLISPGSYWKLARSFNPRSRIITLETRHQKRSACVQSDRSIRLIQLQFPWFWHTESGSSCSSGMKRTDTFKQMDTDKHENVNMNVKVNSTDIVPHCNIGNAEPETLSLHSIILQN